MSAPRVAFFTDSFHEVNGVARTSREFVRFARDHDYPFFSVHTGPETCHNTDGSVETYELQHSAALWHLEVDLSFDLLFYRYRGILRKALLNFRPDLIHITGPGHWGLLGALLAWELKVPLVASWHTNVHEFAGRRLAKILQYFPEKFRNAMARLAERIFLGRFLWLYRFSRLLFAPNSELVQLLATETGRPTYLMKRGINTTLFSPQYRDRSDNDFVVGYVGRLSPEKNVRLLVDIQRGLIQQGCQDCRFLVVGDGKDRPYLLEQLTRSELPGIWLGRDLARAYADMDAFVFPSETDTFGNVVLEAMASGVPPIVSTGGGPKYIIRPGVDGFQVDTVDDYVKAILTLQRNASLREEMSAAARQGASLFSWSSVFSSVYARYEEAMISGLLSGDGCRTRSRSRSQGTAISRAYSSK